MITVTHGQMKKTVTKEEQVYNDKKDGVGEERFPYERFWGDKIEAKQRDHSYRVFRSVERNAKTFPYAKVGISF